MKETLILLTVLFLFNTAIHFYMNFRNKKNLNQENLANKEQPIKVKFNVEFFGYANFMTIMLAVMVVDNMFQFVFVYLYLIGIVYFANKVHKKHLNQKTND